MEEPARPLHVHFHVVSAYLLTAPHSGPKPLACASVPE